MEGHETNIKRLLNVDYIYRTSAELPIRLEDTEISKDNEEGVGEIQNSNGIRKGDIDPLEARLMESMLRYTDDKKIQDIPSSRAFERAKIEYELQNCQDMTEGAPMGDVYDSFPDESNEAAYDALEKAYNAAFSSTSTENLKRYEKFQLKLRADRNKHMEDEQEWLQREECDFLSLDHGNSKVLSWFTDSFDQLVTTRDNILSNIMEEHAHDDITDFKKYTREKIKRKLDDFRNWTIEKAKIETFDKHEAQKFQWLTPRKKIEYLWKKTVLCVGDGHNRHNENVLTRSAKWSKNRSSMLNHLQKLANECKDAAKSKTPTDLEIEKVLSYHSSNSHSSSENYPIVNHCQNSIIAKNITNESKAAIPSTPTEMEIEIFNMLEFLIQEAHQFSSLLHAGGGKNILIQTLNNTDNKPLDLKDYAITTSQAFYQNRCEALNQFDKEWAQSFAVANIQNTFDSEVTEDDINQAAYSQEKKLLQNPFQISENINFNSNQWNWITSESSKKHIKWLLKENEKMKKKELELLIQPLPSDIKVQASFKKMCHFQQLAINTMLIGNELNSYHHQIMALISQMAQRQNVWGMYLIVTSRGNVKTWQDQCEALCPKLRILPYWGGKNDTSTLRSHWKEDHLYTSGALFHVVLTTYQMLHDHLTYFQRLQWQLCIFDSPFPIMYSSKCTEEWVQLLHLRCRQRIIVSKDFRIQSQNDASMTDINEGDISNRVIDIRQLVHFLMPELFDSVEKVQAWMVVALSPSQYNQLIEIVQQFVIGDISAQDLALLKAKAMNAFNRTVQAFISVEDRILENDQSFSKATAIVRHSPLTNNATLPQSPDFEKFETDDTVEGSSTPSRPYRFRYRTHIGITPEEEVSSPSELDEDDGDAAVKTLDMNIVGISDEEKYLKTQEFTSPSPLPPQHIIPASKMKKCSSSTDSAIKNRKRITSCGECVSCISGDCMKCDHCRDMKKYGGLGLRKQSCKNRKCIDPQIVILNTSKEERHAGYVGFSMVLGGATKEAMSSSPELMSSHSPEDSEEDSVQRSIVLGNNSPVDEFDASDFGMTNQQLSRRGYSFGIFNLSTGSTSGHSSATNQHCIGRSNSTIPAAINRGNNARTRVMRCGKCHGCQASDCMECQHCLDMKKYGGPGLRKQSCKNRKCVTPKVVLLNQHKEDEEDNTLFAKSNRYTPSLNGEGSSSGLLLHTCKQTGGSSMPNQVMEWELEQQLLRGGPVVVQYQQRGELRSLLPYHCPICTACFMTSKQLLHHQQYLHCSIQTRNENLNLVEKDHYVSREMEWQSRDRQLALLTSATKHFSKYHFEPYGYAKLCGPGLLHYMLRPKLRLGRLSSKWRAMYEKNDITIVPGLSGGRVDCHLGNDKMIAHEHAVIKWSLTNRCYEISNQSWLSPITVNGRQLLFANSAMLLHSQNLVQIGACHFFFLLPKTMASSSLTDYQSASLSMDTPPEQHISTRTKFIQRCHASVRIPREEIRSWARNRIQRRRAHQYIKHTVHHRATQQMMNKRQRTRSSQYIHMT